MSHFYGGVQGGRGEATRTGHKTTGIHAYIKTWDTSMVVRLSYDDEDGKNYYTVMGMTFPEEDYDTMCAILQAGAVSYYKNKGASIPPERFHILTYAEAQERGYA